MEKEILQSIANSGIWEQIKVLLEKEIDDVKDVTNFLEIRGMKLNPENAYLAKALTATKLKEFIHSIDIYKSSDVKKTDIRDTFV